MNDRKFMIGVIVVTLVIIGAGIFFASRIGAPAQVQANPDARASVTDTTYDWGTIGINDGKVGKEFEISNSGTGPLKLSNIETSCMCTTAQLILGDTQSPAFGMHAKSGYIMEVPPGGTAKLKVVFDPLFHGPSGVGPISRQVTVTTNDPSSPVLSFMLSAVVE